MSVRFTISAMTLALVLGATASAHAGVISVFQGQDPGSAVEQPLSSYPNSDAAYNAFLAAVPAFGTLEQHGFSNAANGFHNITYPGGTGSIDYTSTSTNGGSQISGVNDTTIGNVFGFGVGTHDTKWLGVINGSATFSFTSPTNTFGMWMTGLQFDRYGTVMTLTFNDGANQVLHPLINNGGGAQFFGFTDTAAFTSMILSMPVVANPDSDNTDAWGMDIVSFDVPVARTPLPGTLPLFASGLALVGTLAARRKKKRAH